MEDETGDIITKSFFISAEVRDSGLFIFMFFTTLNRMPSYKKGSVNGYQRDSDSAETEDIKRSFSNSLILNCVFSRMNLGILILTILNPIFFYLYR